MQRSILLLMAGALSAVMAVGANADMAPAMGGPGSMMAGGNAVVKCEEGRRGGMDGHVWIGGHHDGGMRFGDMGSDMMFHGLKLTDEQRDKITHLMDIQHKTIWKQMGDMIDARIAMRDLNAQDQPDPKKVGEAYARISKIRQRMLEARVKTHNEIWALLTAEQQAQLHKRRHGKFGGFGMGMGMEMPGWGWMGR